MSDERTVHILDRLVLFWVALWIVLGAATGITLWRAAELGDTVSSSGTTLTTVGTSRTAALRPRPETSITTNALGLTRTARARSAQRSRSPQPRSR